MRSSRILRSFAIIVSAAALAAASAPAAPRGQAAGPADVSARIARVENGLLPGTLIAGREVKGSSLAQRMAALKIPGAGLAVLNEGRIEWAKGYGVLEAAGSVPVTERTLFQAASISKSVAALGALRLVEQGKLALDRDVNAVLKSWKVPENEFTKTEKVTLRRLLSHTAGLTVHGFGGYEAGSPVPSLVQVLDGAKPANSAAVRVDVVPGSLQRYSGGGFTVAQLLMAEAAGRGFTALMSDLVLKPVRMADSTYEQPLPVDRRAGAATGHDTDGRTIPGLYHTYPEMAAAGLWTTPSDLARFLLEIGKALRGESAVLSAASAKEMTTAVKPGYGLGLSLSGNGPAFNIGHGGSNEGFKCQMIYFPGTGRGAVVMTNGDRGGWLADEILRAVSAEYGWPIYKPRVRTVVSIPAGELAPLTGRYEMQPGKVFTIALEGGTLFIKEGAWKTELFPESANRFFELDEEHTLTFEKGPDGKPTVLVIDGRIRAPRLAD